MSANPFCGFSERINQNVNLDRALMARLGELSRKQARDTALATALVEGRCYGMRQMQAQMLQQRHLNALIKKEDLAADGW